MQELDDFKQDVTKISNEDWYKSLGSENKSCDLRRLTCLVCGDLLGYLTLESKGEIRNKRCIQSIKTSHSKGYHPQRVTLSSIGCVSQYKSSRDITRKLSELLDKSKDEKDDIKDKAKSEEA